jgi:hypothetical protein
MRQLSRHPLGGCHHKTGGIIMRSLSDISTTEFSKDLTPEQLRIGMIIQAALGLGALFFFFAILIVAFLRQSTIANTESLDLLTTLTLVNIVMLVALSSVGQIVYRSRFSAQQLESAYSNDLHDREGNLITATSAEKAISFIRTSMLIRTALFEGSTFFGLAVLMMAATNGLLLSVSWLWINVLPLVIFIALIVFTFPTRDRLFSIFENNIKGTK